MTLQQVNPKQLKSNPWQPRAAMDSEKIAELAESIREHGLLQPPVGRALNGHYELAFGHRRFAAWQQARPGEPFPLDVRVIADKEMAIYAATENASREDLNPIERAQGIKRLMDDFGLTQAEAGKVYNLQSQGAVSHVLGLLKHSPEIQAHVAAGRLAERQARELRLADRVSRKLAIEIAEAAVQVDERDRGEFITEQIRRALWKCGRNLSNAPFELIWPKEPIAVEKPGKGEPGEIRACRGCPQLFEYNRSQLCAFVECFDLKTKLGAARLLEQASKRLKIVVAGSDDKIAMIYAGGSHAIAAAMGESWNSRDRVKKLVKAGLPELRLVAAQRDSSNQYDLKEVFGSEHVALAATNKAAVEHWLAENGGKKNVTAVASKPKEETAAEKAKRLAREEKEMTERRAQRAEFLKAKQDVLWLMEHAARLIGDRLTISGPALAFAEDLVHNRYDVSSSAWPEFAEIEARIRKSAKQGDEASRRQHVVLDVVGKKVLGYSRPERAYDWPDAQRDIAALVAEHFGVETMPAGWNKPPIHHTEFNCWHCGKFASNTRLTKRDDADGWAAAWKGKELIQVTCPDCEMGTEDFAKAQRLNAKAAYVRGHAQKGK